MAIRYDTRKSKCISASPGLTFLSISKIAWDAILNRKTPIASFTVI